MRGVKESLLKSAPAKAVFGEALDGGMLVAMAQQVSLFMYPDNIFRYIESAVRYVDDE